MVRRKFYSLGRAPRVFGSAMRTAAGSEGAPHRKSAKIRLNSSKPRNLSPRKQYFTFDEIRDALMAVSREDRRMPTKTRKAGNEVRYIAAGGIDLDEAVRHGPIRMPAPPSRRSIGGQGLPGCLRPSRPTTWGVREGPPRFLLLRRHRFQSRLSCCRGSRKEFFSYPRLCWRGAARRFSRLTKCCRSRGVNCAGVP
jgi:hypothetical protein